MSTNITVKESCSCGAEFVCSGDPMFVGFRQRDFHKTHTACKPQLPEPCQHNWVSMKNEVVASGEYCTKCHHIRMETNNA